MQPEKDTKDERLLGPHSHLAIDVYDNAMFVGAIDDFLHLCNATQHTPKVIHVPSPVSPALCTGLSPTACMAITVWVWRLASALRVVARCGACAA